MIKLSRFSILVCCIFLTASISFAQKAKPKAVTKTKTAQTKVDLGVLRQNTYTNDTFELKIEFPFGWLVGDNTLEAQLIEIQKQFLSPAAKKLMNRLTPLLGGYRALPGSREDNSNLKIVAENVSDMPNIKTAQDYLRVIKSSLNAAALPDGMTVSELKKETIDGKEIDYLETKYRSNQKRSYVIFKKGFVVLFTIDAFSQSEFDELHNVLTETDLDYKKQN